jgi:DNA-binding sugar fermentation-stimulating protein
MPIRLRKLPAIDEAVSSKYHSRKTVYDGVRYDSQREAAYAAELDIMHRTGLIAGYQRQVPIKLNVNNEQICKLVVDFLIRHPNGQHEYVEVKGVATQAFKLKWKLFDALYPHYRKTIVK